MIASEYCFQSTVTILCEILPPKIHSLMELFDMSIFCMGSALVDNGFTYWPIHWSINANSHSAFHDQSNLAARMRTCLCLVYLVTFAGAAVFPVRAEGLSCQPLSAFTSPTSLEQSTLRPDVYRERQQTVEAASIDSLTVVTCLTPMRQPNLQGRCKSFPVTP